MMEHAANIVHEVLNTPYPWLTAFIFVFGGGMWLLNRVMDVMQHNISVCEKLEGTMDTFKDLLLLAHNKQDTFQKQMLDNNARQTSLLERIHENTRPKSL